MRHILFLFLLFIGATLFATDLTFRRAQPSLNTMDPAIGSDTSVNGAMSLIFEPLLAYDYDARPYKLIPAAAEALPEISEDGRIYHFRLREAYYADDRCFKGVRRRVKAQDFVCGWKRLADRKIGGSGEWLVDNIKGMHAFSEASSLETPTDYTQEVEGIRALDDQTLRIELVRPSNQFAWFLTMAYMSPIPAEAVAYYGQTALSEHPIGAGAYRLKSWWRNYEMIFERNREWWGWKNVDFASECVPFEEIRYFCVRDASTQWLMLLTGQLDFLEQIDRNNMDIAIDPEMGLSPELQRRGIRLFISPTLKVYYIGFNMEDPLLGTNKYLRQAINAAFDTVRWTAFYRNRVKALKTPAPPHLLDATQEAFPYAFNLEQARDLMTKAGYSGGLNPATGKRLILTIDVGNATQDTRESMELLAAFLDRIGIDLQISVNTWQAHLDKIRNRKSQMFLMGWVGDYPDLETFMQLFISRNQSPGPNRVNYINAKVDQLYDRAIVSHDAAEITRCWKTVQEIVREDCPWLFLHYALDFSLVNERVLNYRPHDFPYGSEKYYRVRRTARPK
ncbi:MAG: ABC transporter substrate-binding protein [Kiritimatiellia bacterium]